jgi:hypothetical protein
MLLFYSLRSIKLVTNLEVSRHIFVVDTSISATCFMEHREYDLVYFSCLLYYKIYVSIFPLLTTSRYYGRAEYQ